MAEPIIKLEHITRTYHVGDIDVHALRDVSVKLNAGEFVAIMGSSGSGKSTLMAIIGCLDRPTSGRYFFEGVDVAGLSEPDRARLAQRAASASCSRVSTYWRAQAPLKTWHCRYFTRSLDRQARPRGPSGPAQRWDCSAWANASATRPANFPAASSSALPLRAPLINRPGLLLADEPTGNLDTRTSHEIMETLTRLNREQGVTIVVVTHEADIAAYADRVLTMRDGQIVSDTRNPKPAKGPPAGRGTGRQRQCVLAPTATATRATDSDILGIRPDDHGRRRAGAQAQHDAIELDHAWRLYRRRGPDRDGGRRPGRQ